MKERRRERQKLIERQSERLGKVRMREREREIL